MTDTPDLSPARPSASEKPGLAAIFLAFARVSVLSVGGATMAWIRETTVVEKGWLSEDDFAQALALCQLLPGANTLNMAAFVGAELAGKGGALAAVLGLTSIPFVLVVSLGVVYGRIEQGPLTTSLFQGLGAGAAGVALGTGLQMAHKHLRQASLLILALLAYLALAWARIPMLAVVPLTLLLCGLMRRP